MAPKGLFLAQLDKNSTKKKRDYSDIFVIRGKILIFRKEDRLRCFEPYGW